MPRNQVQPRGENSLWGRDGEGSGIRYRLSEAGSVSWHYFSLTFDHEYRPILRDWGSFNGIQVTYGGQGRGRRRNFQWIIGGHSIPEKKKIKIYLSYCEIPEFQIVVYQHDTATQIYRDNVDQFRRGTAGTEDLFGQLDLGRPETQRATGIQTPGTGPIVLGEFVGEGVFATVTRNWDVSTAAEYALKTPSLKAVRKGFDLEKWKREARILQMTSHVSRSPLICSFPL